MHETQATTTGAAAHERPMAADLPGVTTPTPPGLDDPRFLQVLSTEHWSLLTSRSLAYNEAFTRTGMFLTFLSMSFVGLALIGPPLAFSHDFLVIAAIVLLFDVVVGLLTFVRVGNCNAEDVRAMHGMNRIRHGYVQVVPPAAPYFVSGTSDDVETTIAQYGPSSSSALGDIAYGLSTSLGLVGLIVSLVTGVFGAVVALLFGATWPLPLLVGGIVAIAVFVALVTWGYRGALQFQATLPVSFPRDADADPAARRTAP
jgi:hypothetical protein